MEHDVGMQLYIWQCHIYVYIEQCTGTMDKVRFMSITDKVRYIRITDKVRYTRNTDFVYNGQKTLAPTGTLYARFTVYNIKTLIS